MKTAFATTLLFLCTSFGLAADTEENDPKEIAISPSKGSIAKNTKIVLSFPTPMVKKEVIDLADQPSPVMFEPAASQTVTWKSQTECQLRFPEQLVPGKK